MSSKPVQSAGCPRQELAFLPGADGAKQGKWAVLAKAKPGLGPRCAPHLEEGGARSQRVLNPGGLGGSSAPAPYLRRPRGSAARRPPRVLRSAGAAGARRAQRLLRYQTLPNGIAPQGGGGETCSKAPVKNQIPPGPQEAETFRKAGTQVIRAPERQGRSDCPPGPDASTHELEQEWSDCIQVG